MTIDLQTRARITHALLALHRSARQALRLAGLSSLSPARAMAEVFPELDRGSAQRLAHFVRRDDVSAGPHGQMPGPRAWLKLAAGVARQRGPDDDTTLSLRRAIEDFDAAVRTTGRSFTAVSASLSATPTPWAPDGAGLEQWQRAAEAVMGYSIALRYDAQIMRESPTRRERADFAIVQAFLGLHGSDHAMPFTFQFFTDHCRELDPDAEADTAGATSRILRSGTSRPLPEILLMENPKANLGFLQGDWAAQHDVLDLTVLQSRPESTPLPWLDSDRQARLSTLNVHPNRTLVLERIVSPRCAEATTVSLDCVRPGRARTPMMSGPAWYDRLPQDVHVERIDRLMGLPEVGGLSDRDAILAEALEHLGWKDDWVVFRAEIQNPIPLAEYVFTFTYA